MKTHVEIVYSTDLHKIVNGWKSQTFVTKGCKSRAVGGIKPHRRRQQQPGQLALGGLFQYHVHYNKIVRLQFAADAVQIVHRPCVYEVRGAATSIRFEVHQAVQMRCFALQSTVAVQTHHALPKQGNETQLVSKVSSELKI